MSSKIFVGNLSWNTTNESLQSHFAQFGTVTDSIVIRDRETGRSRGFGFVTYESADQAEAAVSQMNEQDLEGRNVRVNIATDRPERSERPAFNRGGNWRQN